MTAAPKTPSAATKLAAGSSRPATGALVGRADELASIQDMFDAARAGRPTIVLLMGDAGIGKTRLADEAAVIARAAGTRVFRGEADASSREPMELWRGVVRALGVAAVSDPSLPAEERRWEHLEALAGALALGAPAVVVLEDLHWADPIAIWVLEHLPRALGDASVALLATSRDHEPDMPRLDPLRRVSRLVPLGGLDVEAVRQLAAAESVGPVDAAQLHARTGGNPLFVRELVRAPDGGGVIGEILDRSLRRFDAGTRDILATTACAGAGAPLTVLAAAASIPTSTATELLQPALRDGVLDEVAPTGVRFHHALLAEAAERLGDPREMNERLSAAWQSVDSVEGRAAAAGHRLRAAAGTSAVADAVAAARDVAAELVAAGQQTRAAGLLWEARQAGTECRDRPELRANVALDLADVLTWLGDLGPALTRYQEAAELARGSADPVTRARAEVGANSVRQRVRARPAADASAGGRARRAAGRAAPPSGQVARPLDDRRRRRSRRHRTGPGLGGRGGRRGAVHR